MSGIDPKELGDWMESGKTALELIRSAIPLLPKGKDRERVSKSVSKAEQALARSDAALAKELGYPLCHCEFPPRIMLWKQDDQVFCCPNPDCMRMLDKPSYAAPVSAPPVAQGKACPSCGKYEYRVLKSEPHEEFGSFGLKNYTRKCGACGFEDKELVNPNAPAARE